MSTPLAIILTGACVLGICLGQILFRKGAVEIDAARVLASTLSNASLWVALVVYVAATVLWVYVLRFAPLNRVYPVFALAFILVPMLESALLSEPLRIQSLIGGVIIVVGVAIAVR